MRSSKRLLIPMVLLSLVITASFGAETHRHAWSRILGGPGFDKGDKVAIDAQGNVLVTGSLQFDFPSLEEAFVAKYDAAGTLLWHRQSSGNDEAEGLAVAIDVGGNVLVTGEFVGSIDFGGELLVSVSNFTDVFVAKFDPAGTHVWSKSFGGTWRDEAGGITADAAGNVFVTASFENTVDLGNGPITSVGLEDILLIKYGPAGNLLWGARYGAAFDDRGRDVAIDPQGNILITGHFSGGIDLGGGPLTNFGSIDIFVAKYDPDGVHLWSASYGGTGADWANGIDTDGDGNIVLVGRFEETASFGGQKFLTAGRNDLFVAKYDPAGSHLWSHSFGGSGRDVGYDVAADPWRNIFVTGFITGAVDFGGGLLAGGGGSDAFIAKYDAQGSHLWSEVYGSISSERGHGVGVDQKGDVFLTGSLRGTTDFGGGPLTPAGNTDAFLVKLARPLTAPALEIKPGECHDTLNLSMFGTPARGRGRKGGVIPVAILANEVFDITEVDLSSLRLEGVPPLRHALEDVSSPPTDDMTCGCATQGPDGLDDLILKFPKSELAVALGAVSGETLLTLTGHLVDGTPIELADCVTIRRD